jgi:hypothetical protein
MAGPEDRLDAPRVLTALAAYGIAKVTSMTGGEESRMGIGREESCPLRRRLSISRLLKFGL